MAFLSGAIQVGKTTSSRAGAGTYQYMTRDNQSDRILFTKGPDTMVEHHQLMDLGKSNTHKER
jgi:hypothetical protein